MLSVKALKEQIDQKQTRLSAIAEMVKNENRDASKEELAEIDKLQGVGEDDGEIGQLQSQLDRATKLESLEKKIAKERLTSRTKSGETVLEEKKPRIEVPSIRGSLKAFKGPNAEQEAYMAGQFFNVIFNRSQESKLWLGERGIDVKMAHSTTDNEKGGYAIPEFMENQIVRLVEEYGAFRGNVGTIWPVQAKTRVPKRASGFTVYHTGENETITASDVGLSNVSVDPRKAAILAQLSNELLNSPAMAMLGDMLAMEAAYAFAVDEDQAGFLGDGTSTYNNVTGLANALAAGSIHTPSGTGKTEANDFTLTDFHNAIGKIARYPGISPRWYVNSQVFYDSMGPLQTAAGGNTVENLASGPVMRFLGYPVVFVEALPNTTSASTKFAYFGDLAMTCVMAEKMGMTMAADSSIYFKEDAQAIRWTEHYDIVVHDIGTASAAGGIVAVQTTAS